MAKKVIKKTAQSSFAPKNVSSGGILMVPEISGIEDIHKTIEIDRNTYYRLAGNMIKYREYAQGLQKRTVPEGAAELLDGVLDNEFCDNVCNKIISEGANRLEVLRFECPDDAAVEEWLNNFFIKCTIQDFSAETHYQTLRDGDYAVSLDWDDGSQSIRLTRELWWDGNVGVYVAYDVQGEALYAVKEWMTLEGKRRVVWFEDRLERYISSGGTAWVPYTLPEDGGVWPQAWEKGDGSPLHIPIVHFPNVIRGTTNYGTSEIAGGVLGFQDLINDSHYDEAAAARMTGFQQMYIAGMTIPRLPDGTPDPAKVPQAGPGQVWVSENENSKFGVIPAGSIDAIIAHRNELKKSVANMTATPYHTITGGDWPSGEALLRAEKPSVDKALRQILKFGPKWVEAAHRAVEIANAYGRAGLNEDAMINVVFAPPDRRDPVSMSTSVRNLQGIVSVREGLRMMGKSPKQAEDIWAEIKEEKEDLGAFALTAFDKGQGPGNPSPENDASNSNNGDNGTNADDENTGD